MNTGYETVVDPSSIVWTAVAVIIHVAIVVSQLGLSVFLVATGAHNLFFSDADTKWTRRLGGIAIVSAATKNIGAARIALGTALLLPMLLGMSFLFSLAGCILSITLLGFLERGIPEHIKPSGRWLRRMAATVAVVCAVFMVWEGEDGLDLGVEILANMQQWRVHELDWQLSNDVEAPKVGELAPDFELQSPEGEAVFRLADFRGKRPVALIFGSYT
jgi:hypothetical protein